MTATVTEAPMALPALEVDHPQLAARARARLVQELEAIPSTLKHKDRQLAIARTAQGLIAAAANGNREFRDALILSLIIHEGYSALNVADAAGLSRSMMSKILDRNLGEGGSFRLTVSDADGAWRPADERIAAAKKKVRFHSNAAKDLPHYARECLEADALAAAAREPRNAATIALTKAGMTQQAIADATGQRRETIKHVLLSNGVRSRVRRTPEQIAKDAAAATSG